MPFFLKSPTLKRTLSEEMMLNPGGEIPERLPAKAVDGSGTAESMANNPFYSLLGDCYTIVVGEH